VKAGRSDLKRIAMLLEGEFPPDIRVANEARSLADAGFEVLVFSLNFSGLGEREELFPGVTVIQKAVARKWFNKFHTTVKWAPFYRRWWLKFVLGSGEPFGIVHVHDLPLAETGWRLAGEVGARFVLDLHENYPAALDIWSYSSSGWGRLLYPRSLWRRYELEAVNKAHGVIVVTEEALDRFRGKSTGPEKFVVVMNTPDVQELASVPLPGKAKMDREEVELIYVGGFGPHRGIRIALEALALLQSRYKNLRLRLIGSGSDRAELEKAAQQLGIGRSVEFTGWLPFPEAMTQLAAADLALLPPVRSEHTETTLPHKLFQYMYFSKPVVASDCAPLRRIVRETGAGVVFRAGDARDLAQKLSWLLEHPSEWPKMGAAGREAVLRKYNWSAEGRKLVEFYHALADRV